ncbi:MAG: phage gp6-like head-tail connector protein [Proteobacteria bacterium]|nr:phage gp6-like head-tail connector protein [Pseudomonadota bacterium]
MAVSSTAHTTLPDAKLFLGITGTSFDAILEQCIDRASAWVDRHCGRTFKASRYYEFRDGGTDRIALKNPPVQAVYFCSVTKESVLSVASTDPTDTLASVSVVNGELQLTRRTSNGTETRTAISLDTYDAISEVAAQVSAVSGFSGSTVKNAPSRYLARCAGRDVRQGAFLLDGFTDFYTDYQVDEDSGIIYGPTMSSYRSVLVDYRGGFETIPADVEQATLTLVGKFFRDRTRDASVSSESLGGYSYSVRAGDEVSKELAGLLGPFKRIR